jgi:hypothetical protein
MSIEARDLTAVPDASIKKRRRLAAQRVREARDRLTSSSGTRRWSFCSWSVRSDFSPDFG